MGISEFRALVEQRRSIRGYDESREVPEELISMILDCARWAPQAATSWSGLTNALSFLMTPAK
jgi:nitroreductase